MKILVTSDTHNDFEALNKVVLANSDAKLIIHLGDGSRDIEKIKELYQDKIILSVRGNCDSDLNIPPIIEYNIKKKKLFLTHGNLFNVKNDMTYIITHVKENKFDILLFGHTHKPFISNENGILVMNPGSLKGDSGTYGTLDIRSNNIVADIVRTNL